ncbi:MAG: DUF342 domain-containing protein [Candidatus Delongbacteria bacterium]|nr:DUF342 domain-containing protein [Candidatus Delongbacteria bacterium]
METLHLLSNYFSVIPSADRSTVMIKLIEPLPLSIRNQLTGGVLFAYIQQQGFVPTIKPVQLDFWILSNFPHHRIVVLMHNPLVSGQVEIRLLLDRNRKIEVGERIKIKVTAGQILASISRSIFLDTPDGAADPTLPEQDLRIDQMIGEGIRIIPQADETILKAEHDGFFRFDGHRLFLLPYQIHRISPTDSTAQLNFDGDVLIQGDVPISVTLRAAGDIHVEGVVEGATMISDWDIQVDGQVIGFGKAYLQAGGSITVGGAMDTRMIAASSIQFHYQLVRCTIMSFEQIFGIHSNCRITGGKIMAYQGLVTGFLGSADIVKSEIVVGLHPLLVHEFEDLKTHLQQIMLQIKSTDKSLQFLEDHTDWNYPDWVSQSIERCCYLHYLIDTGSGFPSDSLLKMAQLQFIRLQLDNQKELYLGKLNHIRQFGFYSDSVRVVVKKTAHPGILIKMKNHYLTLNEEVSSGQFQLVENQIVFQPNQGV